MRTVLTPCVKICELDQYNQICIGCGRTVEQLREWLIYSDDKRKNIMKEIKKRKKDGLGRID